MLEIRNLHVKFLGRDREAVAGVSLSIGEGEIVGLVGESGSGKTVTAMSVAGLLPRKQCAYSGKILLDGAELLPWAKSFTGRVRAFHCSNPVVEKKFWDDMHRMQSYYLTAREET